MILSLRATRNASTWEQSISGSGVIKPTIARGVDCLRKRRGEACPVIRVQKRSNNEEKLIRTHQNARNSNIIIPFDMEFHVKRIEHILLHVAFVRDVFQSDLKRGNADFLIGFSRRKVVPEREPEKEDR
ncbi:hypothetical protein PsWM33_02693 [Pseudovibrio sp. WM33]|nr:hypothetical protein PsWM33_02693 [Pseudovibrio sp. WM33]